MCLFQRCINGRSSGERFDRCLRAGLVDSLWSTSEVSQTVNEFLSNMIADEIYRSAVNAPIIMPEEYRTLQPFVSLLERMGSLYMQHFGPTNTTERLRTTFDLIYEGSLASANTTKPLFAALIKGKAISPSSQAPPQPSILTPRLQDSSNP